MTDVDPHELRMKAGQAFQGTLDVLDEEVVEALAEIVPPVERFVAVLREKDVALSLIVQLMVGMAIAASFDESGEQ